MKGQGSLSRRTFLKAAGVGTGLLVVPLGPVRMSMAKEEGEEAYDWNQHYWAYAVDTTKCIGCCACMRACRDENDVPSGYSRTWIERVPD